MKLKIHTWLIRLFWIVFVGALLLWGLRNIPLTEIRDTLRRLQLWEIGALLALNAVIFILITLRWWLILRADAPTIPFWPPIFYRLAVFGASYFTPGPQVGGEPLQVLNLQRNYGLTFARATAAVIMDKLIEFLGNFLFLILGLYAIFRSGILIKDETFAMSTLIPLSIAAFIPVIHIELLHRGIYPVGFVMRRVFKKRGSPKWVRLIIVSERLAGQFTCRHLRALLASTSVSLLFWIPNTALYLLMLTSLQIHLTAWQALTALTISWLAFLVPVPAGLGALEAGQIFALGAMGYSPATALSLTLLMRARDILNGGLGLLISGRGLKIKAGQGGSSG